MLLLMTACILFESAQVEIGSIEFVENDIGCLVQGTCDDQDEDGVISWYDCDDTTEELGAISQDFDCDGIVNLLDSCPNDPFNDFDLDGICGDEDRVCNGHFLVDSQNQELNLDILSNCEEIVGDLLIVGTSLSSIVFENNPQKISGGLYIANNAQLEVISSTHLSEIGTDIFMGNNAALTIVSGFDSLERVRRLEFQQNLGLIEISGFNGLASIEAQLIINDHSSLEKISGFSNLDFVLHTEIRNNPQLCLSTVEEHFANFTVEEWLLDGIDSEC